MGGHSLSPHSMLAGLCVRQTRQGKAFFVGFKNGLKQTEILKKKKNDTKQVNAGYQRVSSKVWWHPLAALHVAGVWLSSRPLGVRENTSVVLLWKVSHPSDGPEASLRKTPNLHGLQGWATRSQSYSKNSCSIILSGLPSLVPVWDQSCKAGSITEWKKKQKKKTPNCSSFG